MSNWQGSPASNPFVAIGVALNRNPMTRWMDRRASLRNQFNLRQQSLGKPTMTSVGYSGTSARKAALRQQADSRQINAYFDGPGRPSPGPSDAPAASRPAVQPKAPRPRPSAASQPPTGKARRRMA